MLFGEGNTFIGVVTENDVAQQLAAKEYDIYYWESNNTAELDFALQKVNQIIGIEVRSCLKQVKTPKRRIFFRHSALKFSYRVTALVQRGRLRKT